MQERPQRGRRPSAKGGRRGDEDRTPQGRHRKIGPQAVPRGFLRMYMLALTSRGPETGYSIMQHINEKTSGAWRPGPGTIYPLLKTLAKEGLVEAREEGGRLDSTSYSATAKGRAELDEMRKQMERRGTEGKALMGLVGELFSPEQYTSFFTSHYGSEHELFAEKVLQLPDDDRRRVLREVEQILERQLGWIRSQLGAAGRGNRP